MDPHLRKELQIRARVDSIFNKSEDQFPNKQQYDDYLELKEDLIFNLVEGIDVEAQEQLIKQYKKDNADDIACNEARRAEEFRKRAASHTAPGHAEEAEHLGISGTAAAFHGGHDAEPHQGMEYTAALPTGFAAGASQPTGPLGDVGPRGDLHMAGTKGEQSNEEWERMALSSGWKMDMPKKRAVEEAFDSVLCF